MRRIAEAAIAFLVVIVLAYGYGAFLLFLALDDHFDEVVFE